MPTACATLSRYSTTSTAVGLVRGTRSSGCRGRLSSRPNASTTPPTRCTHRASRCVPHRSRGLRRFNTLSTAISPICHTSHFAHPFRPQVSSPTCFPYTSHRRVFAASILQAHELFQHRLMKRIMNQAKEGGGEATGEGVTAADPAAPRRERKALNRLTKKEASLSLSLTHTIVPTPTFPHMRQCHLSPLRQTHSLTHDALNRHSSFQLDNL